MITRKIKSLRLTHKTACIYGVVIALPLALILVNALEVHVEPLFVVITFSLFIIACVLGDCISVMICLILPFIKLRCLNSFRIGLARLAYSMSNKAPFTGNILAWCLFEADIVYIDEAAKIAQMALSEEPSLSYNIHTYGCILCRQGYYRKGIAFLRKALNKNRSILRYNYDLGYALSLSGLSTDEKAEGLNLLKRSCIFHILSRLSLNELRNGIKILRNHGLRYTWMRWWTGLIVRILLGILLFVSIWRVHIAFGEETLLWGLVRFKPQPSSCWATKLANAHAAQAQVDEFVGRYFESLKRWQLLRDQFSACPQHEWGYDYQIAVKLAELGDIGQALYILDEIQEDANFVAEKDYSAYFNLFRAELKLKNPNSTIREIDKLLSSVPESFAKVPIVDSSTEAGRLTYRDVCERAAKYWKVRSLFHEKLCQWQKMLSAEKERERFLLSAYNSLRLFDYYTDVQTILNHKDMKNNYWLARICVFSQDKMPKEVELGECYFRQGLASLQLGFQRQVWQESFNNAEKSFCRFDALVKNLTKPEYAERFEVTVQADKYGWRVQSKRAQMASFVGDTHSAYLLAKQSISILERFREKIGEKNLRAYFAVGRDFAYLKAVSASISVGDICGAFELFEKSKSRRLLDDFQMRWALGKSNDSSNLEFVEDVELEEINRTIQHLINNYSTNVTEVRELLSKRRKLARSSLKRMNFDNFTRNSSLIFFRPALTASLSDVQETLDSSDVLLEYFMPDTGPCIVFVVSNKTIEMIELSNNLELINSNIRSLVNECSNPKRRFSNRWQKYAKNLRTILLPDSIFYSEKPERIYVVAHSKLYDVPFEVLLDTNDLPLIEQCEVCYIPSASFLVEIDRRLVEIDLRKETAKEEYTHSEKLNSIIAVYNPVDVLAGTKAECKYLQKHLGATILEDATPYHVLKAMERADVIHLAVHGYADQYPPFSFLMLKENERNSGLLDLNMLLKQQPLFNTELVFAASCESGRVLLYEAGDERYSFGTCFILAGARCSVTANWSLPDEATVFFVKKFYSNIESGWSRAHQQAMIECRKKYKHPFYWAGLTFTGKAK